MIDATGFLTTMAAMSAAVQTFIEHVFKRFALLDREGWEKKTHYQQKTRHALIHALSFVVGTVLAYSLGLTPLTYLNLQQPLWVNALAAGFLVSFGGGIFNDVLGVVQEFKGAQEAVRVAREEDLTAARQEKQKQADLPASKDQLRPAA